MVGHYLSRQLFATRRPLLQASAQRRELVRELEIIAAEAIGAADCVEVAPVVVDILAARPRGRAIRLGPRRLGPR